MRNANGIVVRWVMVAVVGFFFSGCKSAPRWDWWRIGKGNPADSSPIARTAGVELPSVTAARAEQGGARSTLAGTNSADGGLAPPFQPGPQIPAANTMANTSAGYSANGYPVSEFPQATQPVGSATGYGPQAVSPGVPMQSGPYDPNSYANTQFAQTGQVPGTVPAATGYGGNMPPATPYPQTPVYLPAAATPPQYGQAAGSVADTRGSVFPPSVGPAGTSPAGTMAATNPAAGWSPPNTLDHSVNSLREPQPANAVATAIPSPAIPSSGAYRPGGTSDYLGGTQPSYSLAARPESSNAPPQASADTYNPGPPTADSPSGF